MRQYYEYWVAFDLIDTDFDNRVSFEEFEKATPRLKKWGIDMSDPKAQWKECDADGFGMVLFDEFSNWAIKKSLDLDDDDNVQDSDIEIKEIDRQAQTEEYIKEYKQAQAKKNAPRKKTYDQSIWAELKAKLPWERSAAHEQRRQEQWDLIDKNKNGYISLAEFEKGLLDHIQIPRLFNTKPVLLRAFTAAKNVLTDKNKHGKDFIDR